MPAGCAGNASCCDAGPGRKLAPVPVLAPPRRAAQATRRRTGACQRTWLRALPLLLHLLIRHLWVARQRVLGQDDPVELLKLWEDVWSPAGRRRLPLLRAGSAGHASVGQPRGGPAAAAVVAAGVKPAVAWLQCFIEPGAAVPGPRAAQSPVAMGQSGRSGMLQPPGGPSAGRVSAGSPQDSCCGCPAGTGGAVPCARATIASGSPAGRPAATWPLPCPARMRARLPTCVAAPAAACVLG